RSAQRARLAGLEADVEPDARRLDAKRASVDWVVETLQVDFPVSARVLLHAETEEAHSFCAGRQELGRLSGAPMAEHRVEAALGGLGSALQPDRLPARCRLAFERSCLRHAVEPREDDGVVATVAELDSQSLKATRDSREPQLAGPAEAVPQSEDCRDTRRFSRRAIDRLRQG